MDDCRTKETSPSFKVVAVRRRGLACTRPNFSCANPTSSIPSSIEQDGDRQAVANGEPSTEVPFIRTSSVLDAATGSALLENRVRLGYRNASSPYPRFDCNAPIVARQR